MAVLSVWHVSRRSHTSRLARKGGKKQEGECMTLFSVFFLQSLNSCPSVCVALKNTAASGGSADDFGFTVTSSPSGTVTGTSLSNAFIPPGEVVLTVVTLDGPVPQNEICLNNVLVTNPSGKSVEPNLICGSNNFTADAVYSLDPVASDGSVPIRLQSAVPIAGVEFDLFTQEGSAASIESASAAGLTGNQLQLALFLFSSLLSRGGAKDFFFRVCMCVEDEHAYECWSGVSWFRISFHKCDFFFLVFFGRAIRLHRHLQQQQSLVVRTLRRCNSASKQPKPTARPRC